MNTKHSINKGISEHGMWKQRIVKAIESGKSEWTPSIVRQDNQCEFGKWLYSCTEQEKNSPHYQTVKELHAKFHTTAAGVLELALTGNKSEASKAIGSGSDYKSISVSLTGEMMKWKKTL